MCFSMEDIHFENHLEEEIHFANQLDFPWLFQPVFESGFHASGANRIVSIHSIALMF